MKLIDKLILNIIGGILGIFLAIKLSACKDVGFIYGIEYDGPIKTILITGLFLGIVNSFIKPVLDKISLPIKLITFGLFSFVIEMFLIWVAVDIFSPIEIKGIIPLFWTTLIIWVLNVFLGSWRDKK